MIAAVLNSKITAPAISSRIRAAPLGARFQVVMAMKMIESHKPSTKAQAMRTSLRCMASIR